MRVAAFTSAGPAWGPTVVTTPTSFGRGAAVVARAKKGIHPKWYEHSPVICDGKEVKVVSGTIPEYKVEVWSGNHPFFQGKTETVVRDHGPLARFRRRYAGLVSYNEIPGGEMRVGGGDSADDDEEEESEPELVPVSKATRGRSKSQKPKKAKGKK